MTNYQIESREWWVERWLELLDSYRFKKRLERARKYSMEGNVLSIEFKGAKVLAKVQGSEVDPYQVSLSLTPFSNEDWNYVIETMSEKAIYAAQLLAGEMPANIEEVFTANGLSLFPFTLSDIHSRCTCPDPANPCKHIGAVYYELGDRFSEDPFVLFQLRGRTKGQILDALRQVRAKSVKDGGKRNSKENGKGLKKKAPKPKNTQTPLNPELFWEYEEPLDSSLVVIPSGHSANAPTSESKGILELLGNPPLPSHDAAMVRQALEQAYQIASQRAIATALNRETPSS
ncbi:SWIM zinc finger family protein [Spirulina subsalsa FACHB-351]|uniref:SWIM zinc finger family protein n=1 Tax=Spirulina subsalsa FACHB-351 TaxID=234711 RepID=A0ABT3L9N4_9CYAN|nr:SWIM zinc finger family protein [Spirulina subsalsa]MCW6038209.1 SWIM zinc finger family protein [Spirulina subsalsa FACHB-351]